ncbi:MAG: hypothetical protein IJI38_08505 [Clostridia bacterium]|nr:hypothetical protein [Clostridia bacterium]
MIFPATVHIQEHFKNSNLKSRIVESEKLSFVQVAVSGRHFSSLDIMFMSVSDSNDVTLRTSGIVRVPDDRVQAVLQIINDFHNQFRFLRFRIINERDLIASYEIPQSISLDNLGPVAQEMLVRTTDIIDQCYPLIMKTCFSEFVL